jgi:hypothetical protein
LNIGVTEGIRKMDVVFGNFVTAMYHHQRKIKEETAHETSCIYFIQWKMTKNGLSRRYTWVRTIGRIPISLFKIEGKEDDDVTSV